MEARKDRRQPDTILLQKPTQQDPNHFSLTESIMYVEAGVQAGTLAATGYLKRGLSQLNAELERQEEALLLEEAERLGLA